MQMSAMKHSSSTSVVSTGGLAVPDLGLATAAFSDCCGAISDAVSGDSISDGSASANLTAGSTSCGAEVVSLASRDKFTAASNAEPDTEPVPGSASSLPNAIGRNSCAAAASAARDPARRATDASRATSSIAAEVASRTITNADMPAAPHNAVTRSFICCRPPGRSLLRDLGEFWLPGRAAQCRKLMQVNFHPALLLKYNGRRHAVLEGANCSGTTTGARPRRGYAKTIRWR